MEKEKNCGCRENMEWISVEDKPLVIMDDKEERWTCTENGCKEFMALTWFTNINTGEVTPWMHHCLIEDEIGLCVVGEDGNDSASIQPWEVSYYFLIPTAPKH